MAKKKEDANLSEDFRITKVGSKKNKVFINAERIHNGETLSTSLACTDTANPEFYQSLLDLGKFMCTHMGMDADWKAQSKCISVAVNYEEDDERMGVIVTLNVKLTKFDKPIVINTPHLREKVEGKGGGGSFMPQKMLDLVKTVLREGQLYRDGERAQQELPAPSDDEDDDGQTDIEDDDNE